MGEKEREKKKKTSAILLNLPLIFSDFVSCGFTVTIHLEKKKTTSPRTVP